MTRHQQAEIEKCTIYSTEEPFRQFISKSDLASASEAIRLRSDLSVKKAAAPPPAARQSGAAVPRFSSPRGWIAWGSLPRIVILDVNIQSLPVLPAFPAVHWSAQFGAQPNQCSSSFPAAAELIYPDI
eukprot:6187758-Pleurochrysis_carterae.AAC.4